MGNPVFGFPLFHRDREPWRRECGNRASDFQGLVGRDGKPVFGFPRCPQPGISAALFSRRSPLLEAGEEFPLGFLHLHCRVRIALGSGQSLQLLFGNAVFQMSRQAGQAPQDFPWRCIPLVGASDLSLLVFLEFRNPAGR